MPTITRKIVFGRECKLFLSANAGTQNTFADSQCVGSVKDLSATYAITTADASDRDSGANGSQVPIKVEITIDYNINCRKDKWGFALLRSCVRDMQPLAFLIANPTNDVLTLGDAYVSNFKDNQNLADPETADITMTVTTELRNPYMVEPALTTGTETAGTWGSTSGTVTSLTTGS